MSLQIPQIDSPLEMLAVCINVPAVQLPDVEGLFASDRSVLIAKTDGGCGMRLLVEKFPNGSGHFHLDVYEAKSFSGKDVDVQVIQEKFDKIKGHVFNVKVESRFCASYPLPKMSFLSLWSNLGMNVGGIAAGISAATLRLQDSTFKEFRWRPEPPRGKPDKCVIEILGILPDFPITDDVIVIAKRRAMEGYERFVAPNPSFVKGSPR